MSAFKPYPCDLCERRYKSEAALADHRRDSHGIALAVTLPAPTDDPACIECGAIANIVGGARIYPHRPDLYGKRFWLCTCGAYCGCHGSTTRPLGYPAGPETRRARNNAHAVFDPLWRSGGMGRREAYTWLANSMGLSPEECHIGMMTADQARQVILLCNARRSAAA